MTVGRRPGVSGSRHRSSPPTPRIPRASALLVTLTLLVTALTACASGARTSADAADQAPTLTIGAIPDQDPQKLQRLYSRLADHLSAELGVPVTYRPVTDYPAAVSLFRTGDLQLVWFGGLTGVQARQQTPGARPLVQRDIDADFHSLFIGHAAAGLRPVSDVAGLAKLAGTRFTYGSQSSTSGYLMPAYFLDQAGVDPEKGFAGSPGLSGSQDKTIDLVTSGTFQAGAVNEQVWQTRLAAGTIDTGKVQVLYRTPPYHDYHWLLGPTAIDQFGPDFAARVTAAFTGLDANDPAEAEVLELFGARSTLR